MGNKKRVKRRLLVVCYGSYLIGLVSSVIFWKISVFIIEKIFNFDMHSAVNLGKDWWVFLLMLFFSVGGLIIGFLFSKYLFLKLKLMNVNEAKNFLPAREFPESWKQQEN